MRGGRGPVREGVARLRASVLPGSRTACSNWPHPRRTSRCRRSGEGCRPDRGHRYHPRPATPFRLGGQPRPPARLRRPAAPRRRRPHRLPHRATPASTTPSSPTSSPASCPRTTRPADLAAARRFPRAPPPLRILPAVARTYVVPGQRAALAQSVERFTRNEIGRRFDSDRRLQVEDPGQMAVGPLLPMCNSLITPDVPPWCPRAVGQPPTDCRRSSVRTGPSSSRAVACPSTRWTTFGSAPEPSQTDAAVWRRSCTRNVELRSQPSPPTTSPSASSWTPEWTTARRREQPVVRLLVLRPRSTTGTSSPRAAPSWPAALHRVPTNSSPPLLLARTARCTRKPLPGHGDRSPTWRPASSPHRNPASAEHATTSAWGRRKLRRGRSPPPSLWPDPRVERRHVVPYLRGYVPGHPPSATASSRISRSVASALVAVDGADPRATRLPTQVATSAVVSDATGPARTGLHVSTPGGPSVSRVDASRSRSPEPRLGHLPTAELARAWDRSTRRAAAVRICSCSQTTASRLRSKTRVTTSRPCDLTRDRYRTLPPRVTYRCTLMPSLLLAMRVHPLVDVRCSPHQPSTYPNGGCETALLAQPPKRQDWDTQVFGHLIDDQRLHVDLGSAVRSFSSYFPHDWPP